MPAIIRYKEVTDKDYRAMSASQAIEQSAEKDKPTHQRKLVNAVWEPFLQFKLLMYMLGLTAIVAIALGAFL